MHARAGAEIRAFPRKRAPYGEPAAAPSAACEALFEGLVPPPGGGDPETALLEALLGSWRRNGPLPRLAPYLSAGFDTARFMARARALLGTLQDRARARLPAEEALAFCGKLQDRALADLSRILLLLHRVERRAHRRAEARAAHLATHDPLTGVWNLAALGERLPALLARSRERGRWLAVFQIDVDGLGAINGAFGHGTGDGVLVELARRLQRCVRQRDLVARLSGDRFACVAGELDEPGRAVRIAQRMLAAAREPMILHGHRLEVGVSVGIALFPEDERDPDRLLHCAEIALYRAKSEGRGRLCLFRPDLRREAEGRWQLEAELRRALREGEFLLHYQPQIDLATERVVGIEALLRWRHPRRGLLAPPEFLSRAEALGLGPALGERVLELACRDLRQLRAWGLPFGRMAVNLGPAMSRRPALARFVLDTLTRFEVPPELLEFELTENVLLEENAGVISEWMETLADRGIRFALDDFGTGYASLVHLKHFPVSRIKIDRSFVRDIERDPGDCAIIRAILGLARGFGLETVAEGVENEAQCAFLRAQGCRFVQGFLFAPPLPLETLCAFLERHGRTERALLPCS